MSKIVLRLPSKQVQYGYVEIEATAEELGDPGLESAPSALGAVYMHYVQLFWEGEKAALKRIQDDQKAAEAPAKRAEVAAELAPDARALEAIRETESDRKAITRAATPAEIDEILDEDDAAALIAATLGATVLESKDAEAPWSPAKAEAIGSAAAVAIKKPWEKKGPAPKVASIDWS